MKHASLHYPATAKPVDVPAPVVVPDCVWDTYLHPAFLFLRKPTPQAPTSTVIEEADFAAIPPAPEQSWDGFVPAAASLAKSPPVPAHHLNDFLVVEELFGTLDLHPGYWTNFAPAPASLRRRPRVRYAEPAEVLTPSLHVATVSIDWHQQQFFPPKGRQPLDVSVVTSSSLNSLLPFYVQLYADSLRYFLTGAASDGAAQTDPDASLGGYRSSSEAEHGSWILLSGIPGVSIDYASRANGVPGTQTGLDAGGIGTLVAASANQLAYAAPGGQLGPRVTLADGETYTIYDGSDASRFVRVTRSSSAALLGVASIEFHDQYGNAISMSDAANAESTAGGDRYRAVMLRGVSDAPIDDLTLYLNTLGAATAVAASGSLPSSGSGTITGPADSFCTWPWQGWCRIEDSGGTLREIVYYSGRTNAVLTVPSLGRGRLGTSAAAGSDTDTVTPVPGLRIAWELASPAVDGSVQTIADETTAPTGLTWSTAITPAAGVSVGTLTTNQQGGLWIHRELPAGVSAFSQHESQIQVRFAVEGDAYTETLSGLYRIAVDSQRRLELRIGVDALPDLSADPDETESVAVGTTPESHLASSPWTTTAELTDDATNYVSVDFRNEYGLVSETVVTQTITLASGAVTADAPSAPVLQSIDPAAAGKFRVQAVYYYLQDAAAQRGDQFLVYLSTDGSDPDPSVDTPTVVSATLAGDGLAVLDWTSTSGVAHGTVGKVLVRVRRSSDTVDSASSVILSATAIATGPSSVSGGLFYRGQAEG